MKTEDWETIKDLFHEALELPAAQRDAFLAVSCGENPEMRNEICQLLSSFENNEDFLENAAVGDFADLIIGVPEQSPESRQFGRYKIEAFIGEGGMGRVFLARDVELERYAALKILSPLLSKDEARVRRFIREAKAASSLNHPNILTIYEIGCAQESHFIATEYVDGETLRQRQNRQPLNLNEIIDVGVQIASALNAAHKARIIHRDIKPENIMFRRDGLVKVLDFGLAKLLINDRSIQNQGPKLGSALNTEPGVVLGTTAYMSPEQARGKRCDTRTDLWSLGVCLYELTAGVQPFTGETMSDVIAEILTSDPKPLAAEIPSDLARIVKKALRKSPADRYQSAAEFLADLNFLRSESLGDGAAIAPQTEYEEVAPTSRNKKGTKLFQLPTKVFFGGGLYNVKLLALAAVFILLAFGGLFVYLKPSAPQVSAEAVNWYESGRQAARNGNFYKAQKMFERSLEIDAGYLPAHAALAEIWMELDYEDKAAQTMLRVTELMPQYRLNESEKKYLLATLATVRRDYQTAAAIYETILSESAEREKSFAYFNLGRALEKTDDSERAVSAYLESVRHEPQFAAAYLKLGTVYWYLKNQPEALASFDKAASIYTARSDYDGLGELFYQKGQLYNYSDKLAEAEKNLNQSLELAKATSNRSLFIKTLLNLGRIGYSNGDTTRAGHLIDEALNLAETENLQNLTTNGLIDLGTLFYFKGEYEKAAKYLEQGLQIARANGANKATARARLSLGNLALLRVRPAEAISHIESALSYYKTNDASGQEKSQALLALGYAYDQTGRYASALEFLHEVKMLSESENDQAMIAHASAAIGLTLIHAEKFPEAAEYCENSIRINHTLGREQIAAYSLLNKAQSLIYLGHFKAARENLADTLQTAEKSKDVQLAAWIHLLLANAALFEGRYSESAGEARKALKISGDQVAEIVVSANNTMALAELRAGGSPKKSEEHLRSAETVVKKIEDSRLLPFVKLGRAELFLAIKRLPDALREALEAREHFAEQQSKYSEWRALAIAAEAAYLLGDPSIAKEYARQSEQIIANFEKVWSADNFTAFKKRSDTIFYQSLIDKVLRAN